MRDAHNYKVRNRSQLYSEHYILSSAPSWDPSLGSNDVSREQ